MKKTRKIRYIGNTVDMEIVFPKWPKFKVYADTETFVAYDPTLELWNIQERSEYNKALAICCQVPWLLVWRCKSIKRSDKSGKKIYDITGDWITENSKITENFHEPFLETLGRIYANHHVPVVYFHNANFDLTALICQLKKIDPDLVAYSYNKPGNRKFLRGAMESKKYRFKCEFDDTQLYEGTISIAKIGRELGYPKIEGVPYSIGNLIIRGGVMYFTDLDTGEEQTYPEDKYIEYAERDVEIMQRYDERLCKVKESVGRYAINDDEAWDNQNEFWIYDKTKAAHAKSLFNKYLYRNTKESLDSAFRFEIDDELYSRTVVSNMGGFTTYNLRIPYYSCPEDEIIWYFDCNSMYPAVMCGGVPWREITDEPPVNCPDGYTTWYVVSITKCEWKPPFDCLKSKPISLDRISGTHRSAIPCIFYIPKVYFDWILPRCEMEYVIHETKYQANTRIIKGFIENLYIQRLNLQKQIKSLDENSPEYLRGDSDQKGLKITMNSLYGKFCEKSHHTQCFYTAKSLEFIRYKNENARKVCILTGAYITFTSRLNLLKKIEGVLLKGWKFLYADTDSVIFSSPKSDDPKEVFGHDSGWLGEWKVEGEYDLFLNNRVKKKYCLLNRAHMAQWQTFDDQQRQNHKENYLFKFALSGISPEFLNIVKTKLRNNDQRTIDDLIYLFDPTSNVLLKNLKKGSLWNLSANQIMIYKTDYAFNPAVKEPTAELTVEGNSYRICKT